MQIREFNPDADSEGLRHCVEALQDYERKLIPAMPAGAEICAPYVAEMFFQCEKYDGTILVAIENELVIGYATIYRKMTSDDIEDGDQEYAYIGDLLVLEKYRGHGYGRQLMQRAESIARATGASVLRIGVLTDNTGAVSLYKSLDFKPLSLQLEKALS